MVVVIAIWLENGMCANGSVFDHTVETPTGPKHKDANQQIKQSVSTTIDQGKNTQHQTYETEDSSNETHKDI